MKSEIKEEILKILIANQETCKIGSDGDYSQEKCVFADDFPLVCEQIIIALTNIGAIKQ